MNSWFFSPPTSTPLHDDSPAIRRFAAASGNDILLPVDSWSSSLDRQMISGDCTSNDYGFAVDDYINDNGDDEDAGFVDHRITGRFEFEKGIELANLLLACAEAVGCRDLRLAGETLAMVWPRADPSGNSLQRVAFCFAVGLNYRLSLIHNIGTSGALTRAAAADDGLVISRKQRVEALHLLHQTTPYLEFAFMAANEAICEAAQGREYLHLIDIGAEHTLQWPSLIRTLASRAEGQPKLLRITAVTNVDVAGYADVLDEACNHNMPVEFNVLSDEETCVASILTAEKLGLRPGETVLVNSVMSLHRYVKDSRGSLKAVLTAVRRLKPAVMAVVEQDANHNGPFFMARFLEALHYYSAVFDSLEAALARTSGARAAIERWHFGEEIRNVVASEGRERTERHERADQWRRQLGRAAFRGVPLGRHVDGQARMLLSLYGCGEYTVAPEKGCLVLGWEGRPLIWASAWQPNNSS